MENHSNHHVDAADALYARKVADLLAKVDDFRATARERGVQITDRHIGILAGAAGVIERLRKKVGGTTLHKVCLLEIWLQVTNPGQVPGLDELAAQLREEGRRWRAENAHREAAE